MLVIICHTMLTARMPDCNCGEHVACHVRSACCSAQHAHYRCNVDVQGERRIRGSALCTNARLVNHDCLPNTARLDNFDNPGPDGAHIVLRTLHALPQGTEITSSYVPLHWELAERQEQCQEVFGFECTCLRCRAEASERTDTAAHGSGTAARGAGQSDKLAAEEQEAVESGYIDMFLLKYVHSDGNCFGTYAPVPGDAAGLMQCNVCGQQRSEEDFMQELMTD